MDFQNLKEFMDRLTAWRIPGNAISVCIDNKEVFRYTSGYSDYEKKIPMTDEKLFNIYSCSKLTTVVAALQLYEKGYFLLDTPIYEFIPEFKEMYVDNEGVIKKANNPITMRHLFTMTSGLTYNTERQSLKDAYEATCGKMNTLDVIKSIAKDPLIFEPGTTWRYGLSHDVLAAVVEVISGQRFRDYVKDHIFNPIGMKHSYYHNDNILDLVNNQYRFENNETDLVKAQSGKSEYNGGTLVEVEKSNWLVFGPEYDSGGAGITTSLSDYSNLSATLANWGKCKNGEQILSRATIELMRTNQLDNRQIKTFEWSQLKGYGYGLGVRTLMDKASSGSNGNLKEFGWGGAAGATVLVDPDIGLSMFYTHHMLNPQEDYYQPRLRNVLYSCL